MDFLHDYLLPSLKICFSGVFKIAAIVTILFVQFAIIVSCDAWGILALLFFLALDMGIARAYNNYEEDQERVENGWRPKHRGK